ncbi:unnamed protein product [Brassica oleracea]
MWMHCEMGIHSNFKVLGKQIHLSKPESNKITMQEIIHVTVK